MGLQARCRLLQQAAMHELVMSSVSSSVVIEQRSACSYLSSTATTQDPVTSLPADDQ